MTYTNIKGYTMATTFTGTNMHDPLDRDRYIQQLEKEVQDLKNQVRTLELKNSYDPLNSKATRVDELEKENLDQKIVIEYLEKRLM